MASASTRDVMGGVLLDLQSKDEDTRALGAKRLAEHVSRTREASSLMWIILKKTNKQTIRLLLKLES